MKKIFWCIALMLGLQTLTAQNALPKWISASLKEGEAVGMGLNRDSAMLDAVGKLYDQFTMEVDSTSLLANLLQQDSTLQIDRRTPWIEAAVKSEAFRVKDTLQQDTAYWVFVQTTAEDMQKYAEQQRMTRMMQASEYLIRAHISREQSNLLGAAKEYTKGLIAIQPCMHQSMASELLEGKDVGMQLLSEYVTVLDGISIKAMRDSLPVVLGEEVPVDLHFSVQANGKPVVGMPVEGWVDDGQLEADSQTDQQGMVKLHIKKSPAKDLLTAGVTLKHDLLSMIEDNYAKPFLSQHLGNQFPKAQTRLVAFDPTPTFFVDLDKMDREHSDSLAVVFARHGMKQVFDKKQADLICTLAYQDERGEAVKRGNYTMATTVCTMSVRILVKETGYELANYYLSGFKMVHPASKTQEELHRRALQLMMRRASDEMPASFDKVSYDKRKVVYGKLAK